VVAVVTEDAHVAAATAKVEEEVISPAVQKKMDMIVVEEASVAVAGEKLEVEVEMAMLPAVIEEAHAVAIGAEVQVEVEAAAPALEVELVGTVAEEAPATAVTAPVLKDPVPVAPFIPQPPPIDSLLPSEAWPSTVEADATAPRFDVADHTPSIALPSLVEAVATTSRAVAAEAAEHAHMDTAAAAEAEAMTSKEERQEIGVAIPEPLPVAVISPMTELRTEGARVDQNSGGLSTAPMTEVEAEEEVEYSQEFPEENAEAAEGSEVETDETDGEAAAVKAALQEIAAEVVTVMGDEAAMRPEPHESCMQTPLLQ